MCVDSLMCFFVLPLLVFILCSGVVNKPTIELLQHPLNEMRVFLHMLFLFILLIYGFVFADIELQRMRRDKRVARSRARLTIGVQADGCVWIVLNEVQASSG